MNYANLLTFSRILLTPFIIYNLLKNNWYIAIILFIISCLTDLFDGRVARYFKQETNIGAYLDPLADKILVTSCYITLSVMQNNIIRIPYWFLTITIFKEVCLILGSIYLINKQNLNFKIEPTNLAKILMGLQCIFLIALFIALSYNTYYFNSIIIPLMYIISILNISVLIQYIFKFINFLKS